MYSEMEVVKIQLLLLFAKVSSVCNKTQKYEYNVEKLRQLMKRKLDMKISSKSKYFSI